MQDPLSQSAPNVYEDPASINAWDDAPVSQSMHTHSSTLSTDKPLPAPSEERDRQRSRNSSLLSVSSGVNGGKIYGQPDTPLPQPSVINVSGSSALPAFLKIRVTGISKSESRLPQKELFSQAQTAATTWLSSTPARIYPSMRAQRTAMCSGRTKSWRN